MCPYCMTTATMAAIGTFSGAGLARLETWFRAMAGSKRRSNNQIKGEKSMTTNIIDQPEVVSEEQWLAARKELLVKEKELTRAHDALCVERRALPWVKVQKSYVFEGPNG